MSHFLELKNITKSFDRVLANDDISLSVKKGEIHALLGENGAGKSTLMNVLYGLYRHDSGEIWFEGEKVTIKSPKDSINLGIGMVHQHFMLVPTLTVSENIAILEKYSLNPVINLKGIKKKILEISNIGLSVDPDAYIWQLSVGEQQRVEIVKALYHGAKLLILDEPTAVLTPAETKDFFSVIQSLVEKGLSIVFITHKLEEVMEISHRVTVLRDGKKIGTVNTKETDRRKLARMMVGRDVLTEVDKSPYTEEGDRLLTVEELFALDDRKLSVLNGISFSIRKGEIYGIAGVTGNGQKELAEVITGMRKARSGKVIYKEKDITGLSPGEVIRNGVSHIPEDRQATGAIMNFTLTENSILVSSTFTDGFFLDYKKAEAFTDTLIKDYDIKTTGSSAQALSLSGGNLQKLIIGRALSRNPHLIVAVHPSRGLDLGAIEYVHKILLEQREKGAAILLISTDLNEILQLSDTVGVIYQGKITREFLGKEANLEEIGFLMAGGILKGE